MRPLDRTVVESVCASAKTLIVGCGQGKEKKTHVILAKNVNRFIPSPLKKEYVSQVTKSKTKLQSISWKRQGS